MNGKQLRAGNCFCLLKVPWSRSQPMYPIHAAQSCLTYGCRSHQREEGGGGGAVTARELGWEDKPLGRGCALAS